MNNALFMNDMIIITAINRINCIIEFGLYSSSDIALFILIYNRAIVIGSYIG